MIYIYTSISTKNSFHKTQTLVVFSRLFFYLAHNCCVIIKNVTLKNVIFTKAKAQLFIKQTNILHGEN